MDAKTRALAELLERANNGDQQAQELYARLLDEDCAAVPPAPRRYMDLTDEQLAFYSGSPDPTQRLYAREEQAWRANPEAAHDGRDASDEANAS